MERIAKAAGIGKQTLYVKFRDKEQLFLAVAQRTAKIDLSHVFPEEMLPFEIAVRQLAQAVAKMLEHPGAQRLNNLLRNEINRFPQLMDMVEAGGWSEFQNALVEFFERYERKGCLKQPAALAAEILLYLVTGDRERRYLYRQTYNAEGRADHLDRLVDVFLQGVMNAPPPEPLT